MSDSEEIIKLLTDFRSEQNAAHAEHRKNFEEVKTVLIGDFDRKGLIGKVEGNSSKLDRLEEVETNRTRNGVVASGTTSGLVAGAVLAIKALIGGGGGG